MILFNQNSIDKEYVHCIFYLQMIHRRRDNVEKLREFVFLAEQEAKKRFGNRHSLYFDALSNLGSFFGKIGDYDRALSILKKALKLKLVTINSNPTSIYKSYTLISLMLDRKGDINEALKHDKLALNMGIKVHGSGHYYIGFLYMNLGYSLYANHSHQQALPQFHKAISALSTKLHTKEAKDDITNCYYGITLCHLGLDNLDSAFHYIGKAENIQPYEEAFRPYINIENRAEAFVKQGKYKEALGCFKEVLRLRLPRFKSRMAHIEILESHQRIADMYAALGAYDIALETYQQSIASVSEGFDYVYGRVYSLPLTHQVKYPLNVVSVLDLKAQALVNRYGECGEQKDLQNALQAYSLADTLITRARNGLVNANSKLFFNKKVRVVYEHAIKLCLLLYKRTNEEQFLEYAFIFSERSKAALLQFGLQEAGAKLSGGVPDSLLELENQLKVNISYYQDKIFSGKNPRSNIDSATIAVWDSSLFSLEQQHKGLIETLEADYPSYYQLKYNSQTLSAQEVIKKLPDQQTWLVSYFQGDSAIYAFCLNKSGVRVNTVSEYEKVNQALDSLIEELHTPSHDQEGLIAFCSASHTIYKRLLSPFFSEQTTKADASFFPNLIIIPDGKLGFIPFETLLTQALDSSFKNKGSNDNRAYRHLKYLGHETQIQYAYSATLLFQPAPLKSKPSKQLAAFAPAYEGGLTLASNQLQAQSIASKMNGEAILGKHATEVVFKQIAPKAGILHLAMHGMANAESPMFSHLLFAPSLEASPDTLQLVPKDSLNRLDDGKLHAYELYNMRLNADLAVLAACESGYGKLEKSEGVMSLSRAFRYAGCSNVIMSHWKAEAHASTQFMDKLYDKISAGTSTPKALQQARKLFLAEVPPDQVHPHYWGNFVLWGDGNKLKPPNYWIYGWISLMVAVVILGVFGRKSYQARQKSPRRFPKPTGTH